MSSTFDLLQTFVTVAEKGSFSAAARSLGKAQSGVSTAISNLEIDLGLELFDRSRRTPKLTPAGNALLREAEAALMHASRLKEHANQLCAKEEASLELGLDESLPYASVSNIFARLADTFPDITVNIRHLSFEETIASLKEHSLDLAVVLGHDGYRQPIHFRRIGRLPISEVVHHTHPLAGQKVITPGDIANYRQLVYSSSMQSLLQHENLATTRQWHCDNYGALMAMLNQGLGWAFIPDSLIKGQLASGELVRLRHEMYPFTQCESSIDMIWNTQAPVGRAALWLRKELSAHPILCA